jgi:hypothetical protein
MKLFAIFFTFITLSAHAEMVITGGFGTDGATGTSMPVSRSVKDAAAIYKALNLVASTEAKESKSIQLADESMFECDKPFRGISRDNAGCEFALRASQKGKLVRGAGLSAKITFTGKLATKIFDALPADTSGRVGSSTKQVANISCTKEVRPGVEATCTMTDVNAIQLDVKI